MDLIAVGILGGMAGALVGGLLGRLFGRRQCPQCKTRFPRSGGGTQKAQNGNSLCLNCGCEIDRFGQKVSAKKSAKADRVIARRLAFGALWCIGLYYVATFGTSFIAGAIAGYRDPANAASAAGAAGEKAVKALQGYILTGSLLVSTIGAAAGWLPGTRGVRSSNVIRTMTG
jgi:hypothetical protein